MSHLARGTLRGLLAFQRALQANEGVVLTATTRQRRQAGQRSSTDVTPRRGEDDDAVGRQLHALGAAGAAGAGGGVGTMERRWWGGGLTIHQMNQAVPSLVSSLARSPTIGVGMGQRRWFAGNSVWHAPPKPRSSPKPSSSSSSGEGRFKRAANGKRPSTDVGKKGMVVKAGTIPSGEKKSPLEVRYRAVAKKLRECEVGAVQ
jgi:hypothetical protein